MESSSSFKPAFVPRKDNSSVSNNGLKASQWRAEQQSQFIADYRQNREKRWYKPTSTIELRSENDKPLGSAPITPSYNSLWKWRMSDSVDLTSLCTARDFGAASESNFMKMSSHLNTVYRPSAHRRLLGQDALQDCHTPLTARLTADDTRLQSHTPSSASRFLRDGETNIVPVPTSSKELNIARCKEDQHNFMPSSMIRNSHPNPLNASQMNSAIGNSPGLPRFQIPSSSDRIVNAATLPATARGLYDTGILSNRRLGPGIDYGSASNRIQFANGPGIIPQTGARPSVPFTPTNTITASSPDSTMSKIDYRPGPIDTQNSNGTEAPATAPMHFSMSKDALRQAGKGAEALTVLYGQPADTGRAAPATNKGGVALSEPMMTQQDRQNIYRVTKPNRSNRCAVPPLKLSLVSENCSLDEKRKGFSSSRVARNPSERGLLQKKWALCASVRGAPQTRFGDAGNTHADTTAWNRSGSNQKKAVPRSTAECSTTNSVERDSYKYDTAREAVRKPQGLSVSTNISSGNLDRGSGGDESLKSVTRRYSSFPLRRSLLLKDVKHLKSFDTIAMIGQGGYAIVRVVKHKETGMVCALKQIAKSDFTNVAQLRMAFTEVDILSARESYNSSLIRNAAVNDATTSKKIKKKVIEASNQIEREALIRKLIQNRGAEYFPEFYGCWQTQEFIFFLMEYLPGGDLMKHLIDREVFPEKMAKFYTAQVAIAIGFLHDHLHYVHRDMKPDNVLFDRYGHTKLVDFGLSRQLPLCRDRRLPFTESFQSAVGTPDYMAPEVHRPGHPHDRTIDWWSLGIILYEMLFGGPPLSDLQHRPGVTSQIIRNWKSFLGPWPKQPSVSSNAKDLLNKLIAEKEDRYKTVEEVLSHPWYHDIDLDTLHDQEAMIVPELAHDADVRNFDSFSMSKLLEWEGAKKKSTPSREVLNAFKTIACTPKSSTTHIPFASNDEPQRPITTSGNTSTNHGTTQQVYNRLLTNKGERSGHSLQNEFKRSVTQHSHLLDDRQDCRRNQLVPGLIGSALTSRETVPKPTKLSLNQLDRIPEGGAASAKGRVNEIVGRRATVDKQIDSGSGVSNTLGKIASVGRTLPRGTSPPMMNKLTNFIGSTEEKENQGVNNRNRLHQEERLVDRQTRGQGEENATTSIRLERHEQLHCAKLPARRASQRARYDDKRTQTVDSSPRPNSDHESRGTGIDPGDGGALPSSASSSSILSGLKNVVTRWLTSSTSSSHSSITGSNNNGDSVSQPSLSHLTALQHSHMVRQGNSKMTGEHRQHGDSTRLENTHSKQNAKVAAATLPSNVMNGTAMQSVSSTCQTPFNRVGNLSARGGSDGNRYAVDKNSDFLPQFQMDGTRPSKNTSNVQLPRSDSADNNNGVVKQQQLVRSHDGRGWQLLSVTGSQCCAVDRHRLSNAAREGNVACSLLNN